MWCGGKGGNRDVKEGGRGKLRDDNVAHRETLCCNG